jgi:hypothetical protein
VTAIGKLNGNAAAKATAGAIGSSGLTMATARIVGRTTAATGAPEEITIGGGLSLSAGALALATTVVTAGSYSYGSFTVDTAGRLTAASSGTAPIASVLTGYTSGAGTIAATDTVLSAIQKLNGNNNTRATAGVIGSSGLTMATARILGRSTAATGAVEEIVIGSGLSLTAGTLTATGGGGGGSPGGSATQVQYQSAGAVFAGAANVQIVSDNLQLTAPGSTPAAAQASSVVLYPAGLADRFMLAMRGPTGAATLLQPSIFSNSIMMFNPQSGTTGTGSNNFQTAWNSNGAVSHPAPSATDVASSGRRTNYANVAATQNQQLGPRFNTDSERCFFRGNVANTGGFFYFSRFRLTCPASTCRLFSGLQAAAATAALVVTDTPTGPYCGLSHVTTDPATGSGALSFVTKDFATSNALPINLGSNLVTGSPLLEFSMYCAPNGGTIFFRLDDVTNGVTYTNSTTANLPGATAMMSPQCQASNGTANVTVGTVVMSVYKIYVESVY